MPLARARFAGIGWVSMLWQWSPSCPSSLWSPFSPIAFYMSFRLQTSPLRFAGLAHLLTPGSLEDEPLQLHGFYCYVRHPLYLFSLILIWLIPLMTVNVLTLNALITLYVYVGSVFEENKLLVQFGHAYDHYRRHVPRLLPRLKRCHPPIADSA
jgi:protein-S-isoprenylcysteine O-methyltransferase Ste14